MMTREMMAFAEAFMKAHPWYKGPRSKNRDSVITTKIDNVLTAEAFFNPSTAEYWAELERRLAVALPHRFGKKPLALPANDAWYVCES